MTERSLSTACVFLPMYVLATDAGALLRAPALHKYNTLPAAENLLS